MHAVVEIIQKLDKMQQLENFLSPKIYSKFKTYRLLFFNLN